MSSLGKVFEANQCTEALPVACLKEGNWWNEKPRSLLWKCRTRKETRRGEKEISKVVNPFIRPPWWETPKSFYEIWNRDKNKMRLKKNIKSSHSFPCVSQVSPRSQSSSTLIYACVGPLSRALTLTAALRSQFSRSCNYTWLPLYVISGDSRHSSEYHRHTA